MAGSNYLDNQEGLFGLTTPLPAGLAEQASAIVDNYLKRPEGLLYQIDSTGKPAYMKALTPSMQFKAPGGIAPGTNVTVTVTPASGWFVTVPSGSRTGSEANTWPETAVLATGLTEWVE